MPILSGRQSSEYKMNKLTRLKDDLNLKPLKYKESISSVTFYGKVSNFTRKTNNFLYFLYHKNLQFLPSKGSIYILCIFNHIFF